MSKQINLVINGKGRSEGTSSPRIELRSVFERLRHRPLSDRQRHENAILKRFIAVVTPDVAKTLFPLSRDALIGVLRIPYVLATLRVNRFPILWLGARCQGIARFAALHLDTCSLRRKEIAG